MTDVEKLILHNLLKNETYARKVTPFLQREYFHDRGLRFVFETIHEFILKYNNLPTKEAIYIILDKNKSINQEEMKRITNYVEEISNSKENVDSEWLMTETETFCKDKAVYNAIMESIQIIDGKTQQSQGSIPDILSKALSVSFDVHIGHDYIEDYEKRYDFYHTVEKRIPFDLDGFNQITNGGTPAKTLNIVMAGTGVGKSLFLCHHAANCLKKNCKVLYITCEMAEERIAERIDANLLDVTLDNLRELSKVIYEKKIQNLSAGVQGKLIIKEYPTATANVNHFRFLLDELWLKRKFKPDVIFIDYLNICASARVKSGNNVNSYTYIKSIAEEIRGLAVEYNVPIFSATQTTRSGHSNTDVSLEDTSESFGLPATADFMFALISTDELAEQNQIMVKQLKNRYNDTATNRKFLLNIQRAKMKLSDIPPQHTNLITIPIANQPKQKGQKFEDWNF
jgi:replicative DNA helicase|tara:strand:+ start:5541 stop:6905 length:1365 start_codon:yes stop_codon:yes gene_type:complete